MEHGGAPRDGRQAGEAAREQHALGDERGHVGRAERVPVHVADDKELGPEEHERGGGGQGAEIVGPRGSAPEEEVGDLDLEECLGRE